MELDTLNLSHNYIKCIENCNSTILPHLDTLDLSYNSLSCIDGLEELIGCKALSVLDLSHNRIEDILIVNILSQMPELRVLTLTGNPIVHAIPSYRKTLTVECVSVTELSIKSEQECFGIGISLNFFFSKFSERINLFRCSTGI